MNKSQKAYVAVALWVAVSLCPFSLCNAQISSPNTSNRTAVFVEPISLGEVQDGIGFALNVGAVVADQDAARGLQKAADVYGINLNLFVTTNPNEIFTIAQTLLSNGDLFVVVDVSIGQKVEQLNLLAERVGAKVLVLGSSPATRLGTRFEIGFAALQQARAALVDQIPKYDQILPVAFPVTPLPDNFFQPSKYPYPNPLVRASRTKEALSADVHAHTSCNMVAQTGNMLHRTSSKEPNRLLMGMEGGNLSLEALPEAMDKSKLSAVMTSWVLDLNNRGGKRTILVENNGIESSLFGVGIHAPEELSVALNKLRGEGKIKTFAITGPDEFLLSDKAGVDTRYRAGMFLVANDVGAREPKIIFGEDSFGAQSIDFYSTQSFVQQFVEILPEGATRTTKRREPTGGILTKGGTTVGNLFGRALSETIRPVANNTGAPVQPYVMALEGGFVVVTPEVALTSSQLASPIRRIYMDLRGPLTSDQSIFVYLENGDKVLLRRTVLSFNDMDEALNALRTMGMISKWDYEGVRGRGLFANIVLHDFLGKHRKFMSSLATWPTQDRLSTPAVRFYVDGMQRLNFTFVTKSGWRQEYVEVPMRIPPVPRDVALYSGKSDLSPE